MARSAKSQVTIGQAMIFIAVFAATLALPHFQSATERKVAVCVIALLPLMLLTDRCVDLLLGRLCPGCRRWSVRRLARHRSFYQCASCGARLKRSFLGPWCDASGPEHDAIFRGKPRRRTWIGFTRSQDPGDTTTTGSLLRSQRKRLSAVVAPSGSLESPPSEAHTAMALPHRPSSGPLPGD